MILVVDILRYKVVTLIIWVSACDTRSKIHTILPNLIISKGLKFYLAILNSCIHVHLSHISKKIIAYLKVLVERYKKCNTHYSTQENSTNYIKSQSNNLSLLGSWVVKTNSFPLWDIFKASIFLHVIFSMFHAT